MYFIVSNCAAILVHLDKTELYNCTEYIGLLSGRFFIQDNCTEYYSLGGRRGRIGFNCRLTSFTISI